MKFEELEIRVYGRVQGVNFRSLVYRKASKEGIFGYVLNRIDGSVEIIVQGSKDKLNEFLLWIQSNPGISNVKGLQYQWKKSSREFKEFSLIRNNSFIVDQAKSFFNLGKYFVKSKKVAPVHVAIIPDGNRRWARTKRLVPQFGHYTAASFQHMQELFEECQVQGVKYLTLWGFSTENWKRNSEETKALFSLLLDKVENLIEDADESKIKFRHIGRKDRLPKELVNALKKLEIATARYDKFSVQLCLDYGGEDEVVRAVNLLLKSGKKKIDASTLKKVLDCSDIPDIDLIIRTSGERRLSGFMPLNSSYAELYFSEVHFPDFGVKEFRDALDNYSNRNRRFGGN